MSGLIEHIGSIPTALVNIIYSLVDSSINFFSYFIWIIAIFLGSFVTIYVILTALILIFSFNRNPFKYFSNIFNNFTAFNGVIFKVGMEIMNVLISGLRMIAEFIGAIIPF